MSAHAHNREKYNTIKQKGAPRTVSVHQAVWLFPLPLISNCVLNRTIDYKLTFALPELCPSPWHQYVSRVRHRSYYAAGTTFFDSHTSFYLTGSAQENSCRGQVQTLTGFWYFNVESPNFCIFNIPKDLNVPPFRSLGVSAVK